MWMNLQSRYELEEAEDRLGTKLEQIRPRDPEPAAA
jgi:plasmid maintenance system antidote protein VapI